ncbi:MULTISPECIES: permease [unclassified Sporosarcina]|uniref:permease n=1 Tax=unclassified Sporosarcina TaxID=2647733 RepID=UPI00164D078C|nr:permease [Sporosarcina sp. resist]QNK89882.1 permease [Sporosarcina sp. resist]
MTSKRSLGVSLLFIGVLLYFFLSIGFTEIQAAIPKSILHVNTIFLSIVLEALPFVFLGVFTSALIQTFVSEEAVQRFIPKNPIIAIVPAVLVSAIFPVCECAIIPVVRRLMKKGMPLHIGIIFIVGAPVLNPIVFASTYYAFQSTPAIAYARMGLAFVLAIVIGSLIYAFYRNRNQLKWTTEELLDRPIQSGGREVPKIKAVFYHASDEFFDMGKFLIMGAMIASLFQTFFDRGLLVSIAANDMTSPLVMMGFAFILSLCSEADAFVASSFAHTFSAGSLLAFLVYGPMLDLKGTIMLFAYFRAKFVIGLMAIITVSVYVMILIYQYLFM